ncbi:hypothetical protein [Algoriphagus sp.]|uniref:hypothetical protein n=1 Tax=Algoriphagus sp. TaxID=1872435 RepID=UPI0025EDEB35|nr:hypothetical protein [Algoriphagus sp.]
MIKKVFQKIRRFIGNSDLSQKLLESEVSLLAMGTLLSNQQYSLNSTNLNDYEFKIFSQFGDDGIIQYLIKNIEIKNEIFIEFGVGDYLESNTRFLMMNNNWSGFVMDGSELAMNQLQNQKWYWKYSLTNKAVFIDKDNINGLLKSTGFSEIGLLHIDLDGNDYHIFKEIDLSTLNPSILILEYNSIFGNKRLITIPYDPGFIRTKAHFSNLFFGASLPALNHEANEKGYSLIGCNKAGNNAYFLRKDLLNDKVKEKSIDSAFKVNKFREGRKKDYSLSYISGTERLEIIKGLEVLNIETNQIEKL